MDEEIFRITKNLIRAKSLKEMALERLDDIKHEKKPYKIVEQYYEIIKELITSLMYSDGLKTLSHKSLIYYIESSFKEFNKQDIILADYLRRLRNDIVYYGKKVSENFLINNETRIKIIIKKLVDIAKKRNI